MSTGPPVFNFSVPLQNLLRFAEDYKKVLLKCKHELVLMLTKNLGDVFEQTRNEQTFKLEMTNMENLSQITYLSWKFTYILSHFHMTIWMLILVRISMLTYMKCIQDFNLVTIIVNHNHFWPQINLNWRSLLLLLIFQNESVNHWWFYFAKYKILKDCNLVNLYASQHFFGTMEKTVFHKLESI